MVTKHPRYPAASVLVGVHHDHDGHPLVVAQADTQSFTLGTVDEIEALIASYRAQAAPQRARLVASVSDLFPGKVVGESDATLGIDVQTVAGAPAGELIRIDYRAVDDPAAGLELALAGLRLLFPLRECIGQHVRIHHDLASAQVVLFAEPANPESSDLMIGHSISLND
jgi:hypothetical protein